MPANTASADAVLLSDGLWSSTWYTGFFYVVEHDDEVSSGAVIKKLDTPGSFSATAIVGTSAPTDEDTGRRTIFSSPDSVSSDFIAALKSGKQQPIALVQSLDRYLTPLSDLSDDIEDGSVTVDVSRMTRRTVQLRVINNDGKYTPSGVDDPFYFNNHIRVHRGLRYIASDGVETDEYVCIGTFLVDKPEVFVERNMSLLTVDGSDRFKLVASGGFSTAVSFAPGTLVSTVIATALLDAGIPAKLLRITGLEDRADAMPTGSELLANPSFETDLTGWTSPTSPSVSRTYYGFGDITYSLYSGSGATLSRVAATDNPPEGGSYAMQVMPNGFCSTAKASVSGTFLAGQKYTFSGYFKKVSSTDPVLFFHAMVGGTNYLGFDSAMVGAALFTAEDIKGWDQRLIDIVKPDMATWGYFSCEWTPLNNVTDASLYVFKVGSGYNGYIVDNLSFKGGQLGSDRRILSPVAWAAGDSRSDFLSKILTQFNLRGYMDVYGYYVVEDAGDSTTNYPVWEFAAGEDAVMLGLTRIQDDLKLINHVIVTSQSSNDNTVVYSGSAEITDATSPVHKSRIGDRVLRYTGSQITSNTMATAIATRMLNENSRYSESIKLPTVCLPHLEGGDTISIVETLSGVDALYEAQRFDIPLRSSRMTIESKSAV